MNQLAEHASRYSVSIAAALNVRAAQVEATVRLLDEGNTVPFIARYRKEATGSLDEEQIRQVQAVLTRLRALDARRAAILASIQEQGQLTPALQQQIEMTTTLVQLEDLYQPFRPKRRTRASMARERGLQGLADRILAQPDRPESIQRTARQYLSAEVLTVEDALAGGRDIVAETIHEHAGVRAQARQRAVQWGVLASQQATGAEDPQRTYQLYYDFEGRIERLRPHQVLAINRGEAAHVLRVKVVLAERDWQAAIQPFFHADPRSSWAEQLRLAIADCVERLLAPAIERDVRRELTAQAEHHAMGVFSSNMRALLSQPPIRGQVVLGIDPGFRTGCKLAVVDATGKVLATDTIYPHEPQKHWQEALTLLQALVKRYGVTLLSIGNGTASRETEQLAAELIRRLPNLHYVITSEAGASVYSASPLARAELPGLDVSLRGAVSIARRLQDGLAELVKIDPQAIGVGMYQHDVDASELTLALGGVVESVVNQVGVDANTASPALLTHVAGVGPRLAEKIVAYRDANGPFATRQALRSVPGMGPRAFEQCAGFLRVQPSTEPLDRSAIHPESYPAARKILHKMKITFNDSIEARRKAVETLRAEAPLEDVAASLGVGAPTLEDILDQVLQPGRDPREDLPKPILRSDVLSMDDLKPGMCLHGTVRNAIDFGAFVDVGVKQDGLLHRSQIPAGHSLQPGDVIRVEVLAVDQERGRISLGWAQETAA